MVPVCSHASHSTNLELVLPAHREVVGDRHLLWLARLVRIVKVRARDQRELLAGNLVLDARVGVQCELRRVHLCSDGCSRRDISTHSGNGHARNSHYTLTLNVRERGLGSRNGWMSCAIWRYTRPFTGSSSACTHTHGLGTACCMAQVSPSCSHLEAPARERLSGQLAEQAAACRCAACSRGHGEVVVEQALEVVDIDDAQVGARKMIDVGSLGRSDGDQDLVHLRATTVRSSDGREQSKPRTLGDTSDRWRSICSASTVVSDSSEMNLEAPLFRSKRTS